jgi:hypothetical protein
MTTTTKEQRTSEITAQALAYLEKSHPNMTAGQRDRTVAAVLGMSFCATYQNEGWSKPEPSEIEWHTGYAITKDPDLARAVPTVLQYVESKTQEATAAGKDVRGTDRMTWAREGAEMSPDELLASVKADSPVLKVPVAPAAEKKPAQALTTLDERIDYVAQEMGYASGKAWVQAEGPNAAMRQTEHYFANKARPVISEAIGAATSGKAKAAAWAATAEAQAMHPAERMSEYRRLLSE